MKNTLTFLCIIFSFYFTSGQENKVAHYKYIIVPQRLSFLKEVDQYQTSSLIKFLLKKNGFIAILDSEQYPLELRENRCKALKVKIIKKSSMFKSVLRLELKDCSDQLVFSSDEGTSRLKDYKKSYHEALRNLHRTMKDVRYKPELYKGLGINKNQVLIKNIALVNETNTLSARAMENGFELMKADSIIVFSVLNTALENLFVVQGKNGILYKKDAFWILEYYDGNKRIIEQYEIRFL
jgi:hypothetical protein